VTGGYGVINSAYATSASVTAEDMQFANNNVQNYAIGYYLIFGKLFNTNHGSSLFQANKITATPGTIANYCTYGLALSQGASVVAANTGVPVDAISITTNTITNIGNNCILISSVNTTTAT